MPRRRANYAESAEREAWACRVRDSKMPVMAHLIGIPYKVELEDAVSEDRIDHVWFTVQIPPCGQCLISVNTQSRLNLLAGFDERVRAGVIKGAWTEKPEPILEEFTGLDYATIEAQQPVDYVYYEHGPLAALLIEKGKAAHRIEAWGELYRRGILGMHQIHSRRASCAVSTDIVGRDGAMRFYLPDGTTEMYLFKYCGQ